MTLPTPPDQSALPVLNIAAYRFVDLGDAQAIDSLRQQVQARAGELALKGTVLLAPEGINLFLAGPAAEVQAFIDWLCTGSVHASLFGGMTFKRSWSASVPFGKLRVRVKREIIRMNHPAIAPARGRAPAVDSQTLRRWLQAGHDDAGRPVVMLDTRNAFEVDHGAFDGAVDWRISRFSDFPAALREHAHELRGKTVVSYCTGGIRCEKAALVMREAGLDHVWQLEGGILQYLEDTGGAHWHGQCFVFDERVALDGELAPQQP